MCNFGATRGHFSPLTCEVRFLQSYSEGQYVQLLCSLQVLEDTVGAVVGLVEGSDFRVLALACVRREHPPLIGELRVLPVLGPAPGTREIETCSRLSLIASYLLLVTVKKLIYACKSGVVK